MTTDCVALEMYFGVRERALGAVAFGTVIVNRAEVFDDEATGDEDEADVGTGAAASGAWATDEPPPEHAHSDVSTMRARARFDRCEIIVVALIEWARRAS
jgi:hypothetical protein